MIALVGCGARKLDGPAEASLMYTGQYFRACYAAAGVIAPGRVYILSARYGLLKPDDVIAPYELRLGQPGAVGPGVIRSQAATLRILGMPVTALCGATYAGLARQVWPNLVQPLYGLGIGRQRQVLARIIHPEQETP